MMLSWLLIGRYYDWLYYHFPDYDIRVIKGRKPTVFKKKHRLIDGEREMSDILSGKKSFFSQ